MKRGSLFGLAVAGCAGLVSGLLAFAASREPPTVVHATLSSDRVTSIQAFGATVSVPAHAVLRGATATVTTASRAPNAAFGDLAVPIGSAIRVHFTNELHQPVMVTAPGLVPADARSMAFAATYLPSTHAWRPVTSIFSNGRLSARLQTSATVRAFKWRPEQLAERIVSKLNEWGRADGGTCPTAPPETHVIVQNPSGPEAPSILACVDGVHGRMAEVSLLNRSGGAYTGDCCAVTGKLLSNSSGEVIPPSTAKQARDEASLELGDVLQPHGRMRIRLGLHAPIAFWRADDDTLVEATAAAVGPQLAKLIPAPFSCADNEYGAVGSPLRVARCIRDLVGMTRPLMRPSGPELPVASWSRALRAALVAPSVSEALHASTAATAAQFTVVRASDRELAEPVLGTKANQDTGGFGFARPGLVSFGGDEGSFVQDVHWTTWGGALAEGTAMGYHDGPHTVSMSTMVLAPARVVAYDLGRCQGRVAYRKFTWYFPEDGEHFHADRGHWSLCGKGYYAIS